MEGRSRLPSEASGEMLGAKLLRPGCVMKAFRQGGAAGGTTRQALLAFTSPAESVGSSRSTRVCVYIYIYIKFMYMYMCVYICICMHKDSGVSFKLTLQAWSTRVAVCGEVLAFICRRTRSSCTDAWHFCKQGGGGVGGFLAALDVAAGLS